MRFYKIEFRFRRKVLICLSLFSGIGGFDLALVRGGHKIIAACEIDKYARTVYARHFPRVPIFEDATKLTGNEFGKIDIICAGFPCQTFSIAGRRLGFEESRGTLFFEIVRIARQKRPRLLLLENVKGLLSHDRGKTFANILATLDELGYDAEWQVLNSKYFVPQNRERIFIIGHLRGERSRQVFPLGVDGEKTNVHCKQINNPRHSTNRVYSTDGIGRALKSNCGAKTGLYAVEPKIKKLNDDRQGYRVYDTSGIGQTLNANAGGMGAKMWLVAIVADRSRNLAGLGRNLESPKEISNSLTSATKDNLLLQQTRIRRLTPTECERLQGFPDNYTEGLSDTQRYKCLGNAVTVPVIEYILSHITLQLDDSL